MAKQRPWVTDVLVIAGFALLSLTLMCAGKFPVWYVARDWYDGWYWVFATPASVARELDYQELGGALFLINPLLYGLAWWAVWRMVKLFRTKPAD